MFCSTVIPTIARPTLDRAIWSVLTQEFTRDSFEVIVVNDIGEPLPIKDWQASDRVRVIETNHRERIFARNAGAAVSKGRYIHFLDDDDWLLPGALDRFYHLVQTRKGAWYYGGSQLVDRQGKSLIQLRHNMNGNCFVQAMAGEWIPLQSSLIDAEVFFRVGGFTANCLATQDVDLCRKITLVGDLVGMDDLVSCIGMGIRGSSTDHQRGPEYSRRARELILEEEGVWRRLYDSACSVEWLGKIPRIYLTSMVWNVQHRRFASALSRGAHGIASLLVSGKNLFSAAFWKAFTHPYSSLTFERAFEEAEFTVMAE